MVNKNNTFDNEARVNALMDFGILDTEAEEEFNEIVEFASKICDKPVSLISLLDKNRQWFKAKVGLDVNETPIDIAFCKHALEVDHVFIVEDATKDDRFKNNPLVTGYPDIKFYAGTQLQTKDGYNVGTLCVIDNKPGQLNEDQLEALQILGRQVMKQMELKRALRVEKEYAKNILQQQEELQHLLLFKDKIFALLSHDLRGPIGSIKQMLVLLESDDISMEEFKSFVPTFNQQINDTSTILDNLLSWSSKQSQLIPANKNAVLVEDLILEAIRVHRLDAEKKGIEILLESIASDLTLVVDKEAVIIVLRNLIKNSIKFCKPKDTITVSCKLINDALLFKVADIGVGFDKSIQEKLFNPLAHVTTYGTLNEKGTGLGLLICKNIVEQNGGKIWAEGIPNKGASFYFTIPR